jgi:hypothetical protein
LRVRSENEAGFTFNELLVTMGLAAFIVMSYSLSTAHLFRQQSVSDHSTVAIHLAQDKIEELQSRRPLLDGDNCPGGGEQGLSAKSGAAGIFSRCWRILPSALAPDLKHIDVTVSWQDNGAREVTFSTLVFTGDGA